MRAFGNTDTAKMRLILFLKNQYTLEITEICLKEFNDTCRGYTLEGFSFLYRKCGYILSTGPKIKVKSCKSTGEVANR